MVTSTAFIVLVVLLAFVFDFINGFHDAANTVATIVTTGVLTPKQAVVWAAFFNFIAFMVFNLSVAATIGAGLIVPGIIDPAVIFAALIGAIFWNLVTWYYGLPSSSSHALVGGLAGAAIAKGGFVALKLSGFITVLTGIVVSPLLGLIISFFLASALRRCTKNCNQTKLIKPFKITQLASSALLGLTHGGNDAQKTMGIIAGLLFSASLLGDTFYVPFWVIISCQAVISLGTLAGGWRVVHTMGTQITELNPMRGSAAEAGAASIIFIATQYGIPVSTTQTVTGAIAGVGLTNGSSGTHWPILRRIFCSWLLTVPAAAAVASAIHLTFF
jgi:PiT family inorganic phosphate transporter